ncbi:hypothetical protein VHEMI03318 [[Torrubiella] hemipterigena]|uniref:Uncharacterized protein n=1 Tax=[Torrubiella] hemipterigena TaxID=1531966 RepID=A0A0A1TAH6_9HYPO|nr:hypothetical protein VHEMI03318 [[Torrubiella] hemipterigena]
MGELKIADFPINSSHEPAPQCAVYIREVGRIKSRFLAHDLSSGLPPPQTLSLQEGQTYAENRDPTFEIKRRSVIGRSFTAYETGMSEPAAQMDCATWSLGHWIITFPGNSLIHNLDMRPAGNQARADIFVVESIPFFWEPQGNGAVRKLWKAVNGERIEVGELQSRTSRDTHGLLKIDTAHVDRLVGIMTSIALLKRLESFRK